MSRVLGISAYYHESAASLIINGDIASAVQEERFTRKKHDASFPVNSVKYCLKENNISLVDIDKIIYYEKPLLTFERLLETYLATAPRGLSSFIPAMQVWIKQKLFLKSDIKKKLVAIQKEVQPFSNKEINLPELLFSEHHLSHAASAFFPSPFDEAAILCLDGVGEWATTSAWIGKNKEIAPLWEINFPHSVGLLYSAFTYYCGFKVNSGEYKLMGLAPYGEAKYVSIIKDNLIDIKKDGTFKLNMSYFKFHRGLRMTSKKFNVLFGYPPRKKESEILQFHMDLAASIQKVTEEIVLSLANTIRKETGQKNLCLAGGVALNCVANGKLIEKNIFDEIWIQPASGDAGTAVGAALLAYYKYSDKERVVNPSDSMKGSYLGPKFSNLEIKNYLNKINASYLSLRDKELFEKISEHLTEGKVVGWFNGAMEFGPRALGARSIIGDPRNKDMQSVMNLKIKYRESFRPFAPSILEEYTSNEFKLNKKSPYMLIVAGVKNENCFKISENQKKEVGLKQLNFVRSTIPAVTHIDYSARIQTVSSETNIRYYNLLKTFKNKTGCPLLINTSFNVRGEPIVCSPEDAYRCFMRTEMDILVLENQILYKHQQKNIKNDTSWKEEFELD